jgi:hypothetical protein
MRAVFISLKIRIVVLWIVTPRNLVGYKLWEEHIAEDGGDEFLRNPGNHPQDYRHGVTIQNTTIHKFTEVCGSGEVCVKFRRT